MSTPKVPSNEKSAPDPPLVRTDEDEVVLGPWRVPTSFKWLAMPTRPSDTADIVWSDGVPMKARYFKCTAFWGTLSYLGPAMPKLDATAGGPKPVSKPGYHVNPHGTVDVFIASEYVLPNYSTGPTSHYHLRDLVGGDKAAQEERWVTMQLNDCFQFGESTTDGNLVRFLVYHPPIAAGFKMPRMYQHRFTDAVVDYGKYVDEVSEYLPEEHGIKSAAKVVAKVTSFVTEIGKKALGDYLRTFLPSCALKAVSDQAFSMSQANKSLGYPTCVAMISRALELQPPMQENKIAKANEASRVDDGKAAIKKLNDNTAKWKERTLEKIEQARAEEARAHPQQLQATTDSSVKPPTQQNVANDSGAVVPAGANTQKVGDDEFTNLLNSLLAMEGWEKDNAELKKYIERTPQTSSSNVASYPVTTHHALQDHPEVLAAKGGLNGSPGEGVNAKGNSTATTQPLTQAQANELAKQRREDRKDMVENTVNANANDAAEQQKLLATKPIAEKVTVPASEGVTPASGKGSTATSTKETTATSKKGAPPTAENGSTWNPYSGGSGSRSLRAPSGKR